MGMAMGRGPNLKHHLSHTDSVRLRLLLKIRFGHCLGEGGAMGGVLGGARGDGGKRERGRGEKLVP